MYCKSNKVIGVYYHNIIYILSIYVTCRFTSSFPAWLLKIFTTFLLLKPQSSCWEHNQHVMKLFRFANQTFNLTHVYREMLLTWWWEADGGLYIIHYADTLENLQTLPSWLARHPGHLVLSDTSGTETQHSNTTTTTMILPLL